MFVEALVLVVVCVSAQQSTLAPFLYRPGRDAKQSGHLAERQDPDIAQPLIAPSEPLSSAYPLHHGGVEVPALPREDSTLVQDGRDLPLGVVIEQCVELGDDRRRGLSKLLGGLAEGQPQAPGRATPQAHPHGDLLALDQGDDFDKQACHALALALRDPRLVPQPREVRGKRKNLLLLGVPECGVLMAVQMRA